MAELRGVCTPVCTIFSEDGSVVDDTALRNHLDTLIEAGVPIVTTCGGTGEFSFLRAEERRQVTEVTARHIEGQAQLIVHASAVMTEEAIEYAKHAESLGADALLLLPPYFEGPNMQGVYEHYARVAEAVSTPIMAYNIPVHSGIYLDPDFYARLCSEIDTVRYLKDSTGDFLALQEFLRRGAKVFVGCDPLMYHGVLAGAAGCFWGTANAIPAQAVKLYELAAAGELQAANALWQVLYPVNQFVWSHPFNPSVKAAGRILGHDLRECRRPAQPLTNDELAALREALQPLLA
ncbi:MAG: dihydrodipicolinate synthase family protein [Gammaproteobacteria bacterium]|nr:dihydrodipicolinate synthase family protein [Gammaproteobacteria bacterium]